MLPAKFYCFNIAKTNASISLELVKKNAPGRVRELESESEIFIRSFQTQETSAKTITGRCRRGHLEK